MKFIFDFHSLLLACIQKPPALFGIDKVHKDIKALLRFGLVELDPDRKVRVPWDSAEIQFSLLGGKT